MKIRPQMQGEGTWGHRNSQIFQRGNASPFDPCCHCVDVAGCLCVGSAPANSPFFFTVCQLWDCGIVSLNYDVFILGLPLHNIPKNIYILTQTGASPQAWLMEAPT